MSEDNGGGMAELSRRRTPAEWTTLSASLAVVLLTAVLLVYRSAMFGERAPAFEVTPIMDRTRAVDGLFYLPVEVRNTGDRTAENVRVRVGPADRSSAESPPAQFEVRFLAGGEVYRAEVVLDRDPARAGVSARVVSFSSP